MSVVGLGLDLVDVGRIAAALERHGEHFLERLCREGEVRLSPHAAALPQHVAGLFAAKEAVLKALGTGWAEGLGFRQVEILRADGGCPDVRLHGRAAARAAALGATSIRISITHDRTHAAAVALLEGDG